MAEIGLYSGRIGDGIYLRAPYTIFRKRATEWHIYKFYNTDAETLVKKFKRMGDADFWCRQNRNSEAA